MSKTTNQLKPKTTQVYTVFSIGELEAMIEDIRSRRGQDAPKQATSSFSADMGNQHNCKDGCPLVSNFRLKF